MWRVKKWFDKKSARKKEYEKEKREFEMAIGKPFITLKIELPVGFDDQRSDFLELENNVDFVEEIENFVKKNLVFKRRKERKNNRKET